MPKLKVFCTTSGFYDHVVAAPSRPAALKAWGAKTDLFSMGVARLVTDRNIEKKALARPGEVIRLKRSDGDQQAEVVTRKPAKRRTSKPDRGKLSSAEKQLEQLTAEQDKEIAVVERQLNSLQRKRDQMEKRHLKKRAAAEKQVERAKEVYEAALDGWDPGD